MLSISAWNKHHSLAFLNSFPLIPNNPDPHPPPNMRNIFSTNIHESQESCFWLQKSRNIVNLRSQLVFVVGYRLVVLMVNNLTLSASYITSRISWPNIYHGHAVMQGQCLKSTGPNDLCFFSNGTNQNWSHYHVFSIIRKLFKIVREWYLFHADIVKTFWVIQISNLEMYISLTDFWYI